MFDIDILTNSDTDCNNLIENNTGSGDRPIKYFNYSVNLQNEILSELILCNADNSNINNVTIAGSDILNNNGLLVWRTENSNFKNINSSDNFWGIYLGYSSNNTLTNNTANNNWIGIDLYSSSNNTINNNTANNNNDRGIYLCASSNNNTINNNTANNNYRGISLDSSSNNTLTNNTANNNWIGIDLYSSSNNTINNNTASNNSYGINFGYGSNNNTMIANNMCYNSEYDVYNVENSNSTTGDNNTCVTSYNYNDTNSNGCKYVCSIDSCNCSSCGECSYKLSHPSCSQVNLTANIINQSGNCINDPLNFNNKIFDCQGNIIDRNVGEEKKESYGIDLHGKQNNTIKNCIITGFYYGIYLSSSSSNILTNNTANLNREDGISLYSSSNNILTNNTANNNHLGIDLYSSSNNNTLTNNTANNNNYIGIRLYCSSNNNTLTNNTAKENNIFDIGIWTNSDAHCNNLIENNTGSGDKPIKYFNYSVNLQNEILSELILCNADNSNISNVTIAGSDTLKNNGLIIYFTENSNFTNINSSDNFEGIYLSYSSNTNTITNNTANNNSRGIYLGSSSNNTITNNTANSNSYRGISLYYSSNNILTNNTANSNNDAGICLLASDNNNLINNNVKLNGESGILLFSNSNFNNISNNKILDNNQGITISNCHPWEECSEEGNINNTIQGNEISNNSIGIYSVESNSTINSNIFCRNTNLDFNSSDWFSSSGDNNTCSSSKVNGWKDIGRTGTGYGCKNEMC
ncbi:conserved hypothetical protein [groundwater metagenome]|uniref:Carbohydrate-binding/sugar hydrolysis domain-containing protein n=1 Tax=groundwater metagenome TaxID=717931 RepID=A0A098EBV1_9ZZZZ